MLKSIKKIVTKLVYPDGLCCLLCGAELADAQKGLCPDCSTKMIVHFCLKCGVKLNNSLQNYCDSCLYHAENLYFDAARSPYLYSEKKVKKMVLQLKFGKTYVAEFMAIPMFEVFKSQSWNIDFITYVPIHQKKRKKKGFDHAQLLAERMGILTGRPVITTLEKLTYTKETAKKLGREDRRRLINGSFALTGTDIKGKNVLLVDDVLTTHTTSNECARMLKLGKAARVYVLTYATGSGDFPNTYINN